MEVCAESSHSNGPQTLKYSKSADEVRSNEKAFRSSLSNGKQSSKQTSTFVNHVSLTLSLAKIVLSMKGKCTGRRYKAEDCQYDRAHSPEIAWHEDRRKWVGDKSQHPPRMTKDPIISWSTSYDELLSTNEPFAEPIPLPEMVDFLVDVWLDEEGLFD